MTTTDLEGTVDSYASMVRDLKYYGARINSITFDPATGTWFVLIVSNIMPGMPLMHTYELPVEN